MDGLFFYFLMWFLFIYVLFFTNDNWGYRKRFIWGLLLLISVSSVTTVVGNTVVSGCFLLFLLLFFWSLKDKTNYQLFSLVVGVVFICLTAFLIDILVLLNPVLSIFNDNGIKALILFLVLSLFCEDPFEKLIIFVIGVSFSGFILNFLSFSLFSKHFYFSDKVLDQLAILIFIVFLQTRWKRLA